jgi:hypothetical protein
VALDSVVDAPRGRLISIFPVGPDARRPCFGGIERMQRDPAPKYNILFYRVFQGDNAGLGASDQTGRTGIVADMIRRRHGATPESGEMLREVFRPAADADQAANKRAPVNTPWRRHDVLSSDTRVG